MRDRLLFILTVANVAACKGQPTLMDTDMTTNTDGAMPELPTIIIEPPEFAPRPSISDNMSQDDLWSYACLVGYRYKLSDHDQEQCARAAIQQAAGAVPEGLHKSWGGYQERCPHGVRWENRCTSCASPSPPKQQPVHLGGGEGGGVTQWRIEYSNDTGPDDGGFWEWWEVTNGIVTYKANTEAEAKTLCAILNAAPAPRPESPTGQINKPATAGQGMEGGDHG